MTAVTLLAIKVDSPPNEIALDTQYGHQVIRLETGVHLDITDASEDTCLALAHKLLDAASLKRIAAMRLPEVA